MSALQQRIGVIFGLFFMLLVLAAGRTAYLGVVRSASLRKAASNQQLTNEVVIAPRGTISDRNGVELAVSEPARDISADPYLLSDALGAAQKLAPLLGQSEAEVLRKLSEHSGFVYLARALPGRQAQRILELKIPGVAGTPVMRRVYPRGTLAAQVLGIVGTEGTGLAGLEYSRNKQLGGRTGQRRVVSDAIGQPVSITESKPVVPGEPLTLTLDANIQQRTEDVLGAVARVFNPKDATAIVMDPRSGAILALANWPQVDANDPAAAPAGALADRAVSFDYEPGSTFKAVTVSGALQQGLITPDSPLTSRRRSRWPTGRSTTTPNTAKKRSRPPRSSPVPATWARSRSANSRVQKASTAGCTGSASGRARASICPARRGVSRWPWTTTRAPRWATSRLDRASSSRRCRWRAPTP